MIEADGYLYAIGGNDGSSSLNTVERYEPVTNKWLLVNSMMLRRSSVGAAALQCPITVDFIISSRMEKDVISPVTAINLEKSTYT